MSTPRIDLEALRAGQRRTLAKAITLLESKLESQQELARERRYRKAPVRCLRLLMRPVVTEYGSQRPA